MLSFAPAAHGGSPSTTPRTGPSPTSPVSVRLSGPPRPRGPAAGPHLGDAAPARCCDRLPAGRGPGPSPGVCALTRADLRLVDLSALPGDAARGAGAAGPRGHRVGACLRPGAGHAGALAAGPARRRGPRPGGDAAPHRRRRLVHRPAAERTRRVLRRPRAGPAGEPRPQPLQVRRLRRLAARPVGRGRVRREQLD
ncbi:hypothetical protein LT493_16385 [Streptomyces tricolor]|nr:hypothetical protein [Streptomyces tricolor]